jgi:hypothetical protein
LSPFQRISNQHKILRFLIPIPTMAFTKKENSGVIKDLFANFECICPRNGTFSDILQQE